MKKTFLSLFVAAVVLAAPSSYTGVITDTMCGSSHNAMKIQPNAKCVRDCVKLDKKWKYALHDGKNLYVLSDQQTPEKFAGERVRVKGMLYEKTGIIKVDSIEPVK